VTVMDDLTDDGKAFTLRAIVGDPTGGGFQDP
jgi:hypothetical protein